MKRHLFKYVLSGVISVLTITGIVSCKKKSEEEPKPKTTQELINGKWRLIIETSKEYDNSNILVGTSEYLYGSNDYIEFNTNNTYIYVENNTTETGSYTIINSTTINMDGRTFIIKKLDATDFIIEETDNITMGKTITTTEMKR